MAFRIYLLAPILLAMAAANLSPAQQPSAESSPRATPAVRHAVVGKSYGRCVAHEDHSAGSGAGPEAGCPGGSRRR